MPSLSIFNNLKSFVRQGLSRYVTDGLKLYMPYKQKTGVVGFVGTGSTSFDGTNDYITVGSSLGDLGSSATFCAWIYRTDTSGYDYYFDAREGGGDGWCQGSSGSTGFGKSEGTIYVDGVASSTMAVGEWHHLAITGMTINASTSFLIGGYNASLTTHMMKGSMKNIAVWNRNLTPTEIQNVMYKSYGGFSTHSRLHSGLVSWWSLDAKDSLGSELITADDDRTFDSDTSYWSRDTGVTIANGVCRFSSVGANQGIAKSGTILSSGTSDKIFQLSFDLVAHTSGDNIQFYVGGNTVTVDISSGELKTYKITAGDTTKSNDIIQIRANESSSTFDIDNFSIKEVSIEDLKGSNDGTISGATVDDDLYGGDTPVIPRGIDNAPTVQADAIGAGSASFTSSNTDFIKTGSNVGLTLAMSRTVTCWVKFDTVSADQYLYVFGEADTRKAFGMYMDSSGNLYYISHGDDLTVSAGAIVVNTWYHLAYTFANPTTMKGYIDGVLKGTNSSGLDTTASVMRIGVRTGEDLPFDGNICQMGVWAGELTQAEIQSVMEKTFEEFTADDKSILGSEINTTANATSPTNETDAVTGLTDGGGSPVQTSEESISGAEGTHTFKMVTSANEDWITATWTVLNATLYKATIRWKTTATNSPIWRYAFGTSSGASTYGTTSLNGSTDWQISTTYFTTSSTSLYLFLQEYGADSDILTLYIDYISIKAVTHDLVSYWALDEADGDDVQVVLDKVDETYGSELIVGGTFEDAEGTTDRSSGGITGWTVPTASQALVQVSKNAAKFTGNGIVTNGEINQTITTVSGKTYRVTLDYNNIDGNSVRVDADGTLRTITSSTGSDSYTLYFVAGSTSQAIKAYGYVGHNQVVYIDNISVKLVNGNPGLLI